MAQNYAPDSAFGGFLLDLCPPFLRSTMKWAIPFIYKSRKQLNAARHLLTSITEERVSRQKVQGTNEKKLTSGNNSIVWFEQAAKGDTNLYDPAAAQLALTFVADHTSANFVMMVLLELARHQDMVEPVLNEIQREFDDKDFASWTKTKMYNMKILDSIVKESMRLRPIFYSKYFTRLAIQRWEF